MDNIETVYEASAQRQIAMIKRIEMFDMDDDELANQGLIAGDMKHEIVQDYVIKRLKDKDNGKGSLY